MAGAFLYLVLCSMRNRIRVRLRRLRQPRYLIGSIVGLGYLYFMVFRRAMVRPSRRGLDPNANVSQGLLAIFAKVTGPIEFIGSIVLFVTTMSAWLVPGVGQPIEFSQSEVQFLFQAPVTRRQLLHYKLLRGQIGAIIGSAVATVFLRPASFARAWTFLVGMWLVFAIVRLHFTGIALRRQSLAHHGRSALSRNAIPLTVVVSAVLVIAATVVADWPALASMTRAGEVFDELQRLAVTGAARWVLWPFRAVAGLPLATSTADFLRLLPVAGVLLLLNYLWVVQGDAAFTEASAADAEKRAAERGKPSAARRGGKPLAGPFTLSVSGRPETAILWKNLILLGRYASLRALLRFVPIVIALAVAFSRTGGTAGVASLAAVISLMLTAMTILIGPQLMRNDLRQDLGSLPMLKSWPIRGAALVRGEVLAPALVLTLIAWMLIFVACVFGQAPHGRTGPPPFVLDHPAVFAIAAGLIAAALILIQVVLHNGIAIAFPAWVSVGTTRARGIDAMGQRLLMMAGVVLTLVVALLPAVIAAGLLGFPIYLATRTIPIVWPAVVILVVVMAECWAAAELLGRVLDRTDISAIEAVE